MSVTVNQSMAMTIVETPAGNTGLITTVQAQQFDRLNTSTALTSGTTPAVTKQISMQVTMSAGVATLDLTNAAGGVNGATVTASTLKVVGYLLNNPITNANAITITTGASNGYPIFGASGLQVLNPGESIALELTLGTASAKTTVDGTHKTIDISGTGSQVLNVQMAFG